MGTRHIAENRWDTLKKDLSQKWADLTEEDLASIREDVGRLATRLQERYGFSFDDARYKAQQFLDEADEVSTSFYRNARGAAMRTANVLDNATHRDPWTSIGVAFLLGGLVGYACAAAMTPPPRRWHF